MELASQTVDPDEIARFSAMAADCWEEKGSFRLLHRFGPLRLQYVHDQACAHFLRNPSQPNPLLGLTLLDIGCGGGLLSEPMASLGAEVTGIDASAQNIAVASLHAAQTGLKIGYECCCPEALLKRCPYDIVLVLEVVEHVPAVPAFLAACAALVKPGGLLIMSTLNRTAKSYVWAILGAEYLLQWVPRGTHSWKKFLSPSELCTALRREKLIVQDTIGMPFNPLTNTWRLTKTDLAVNYILTAVKAEISAPASG